MRAYKDLAPYEIRRLIQEREAEGYSRGKEVVRVAFAELSLWRRVLAAFRGQL